MHFIEEIIGWLFGFVFRIVAEVVADVILDPLNWLELFAGRSERAKYQQLRPYSILGLTQPDTK